MTLPTDPPESWSRYGELTQRRGLVSAFRAGLQALSFRRISEQSPRDSPTARAYGDNESFWNDAISDVLWDGRAVELHEFNLTEWSPQWPGLYHTSDARRRRFQAISRIASSQQLGPHLLPVGKTRMIEGGVSCVRLAATDLPQGLVYVIGASSTDSCAGGIPVVLNEQHYELLVEEMREVGVVRANFRGRVRLLPEVIRSRFPVQQWPCYALVADEVRRTGATLNRQNMTASVQITFGDVEHYEWLTSFSTFQVGRGERSLDQSVDWMRQYVEHYSNGEGTRIVADFDAYRTYFPNVDLPLSDVASGRVSPEMLKTYLERFKIEIQVTGDYVEGDKFSGIKDSSIINRSTIKQFDGEPPAEQ